MGFERKLLSLAAALSAAITLSTAGATPPTGRPSATLLATGLQGALGSALGPGGALYVTEGVAGRISRVDPRTGQITAFASGLPTRLPGLPISGAIDVAFIGTTAYALVTLVGADVGGSAVVGIYRMDGPTGFTPVADIGAFSLSHPPAYPVDVPTGVQYALEPYRGGFLVTDGHHNRVLRVTLDGKVSELIAFDNIVPTGLAVSRNKVYVAEAGPVPHEPQDGKVVKLQPKSRAAKEVAAGARFLVDVEFGRGHRLYALSQGDLCGRWARCSGAAEHRLAREGQAGWHLHRHRGWSEPADVGRVHREHRVRRVPHGRDLEGRGRPPWKRRLRR